MQTKDRLLQKRVLLSMLLLFGILSSAFHMGNLSAANGLSPVLNLDDDASAWGVFTEVPTPGTPPPTWQLNNASSSVAARKFSALCAHGRPALFQCSLLLQPPS